MIRMIRALALAAAFLATHAAAAEQANVVSKWNSVLLNQVVLGSSAPYKNARQIAILNLSLYNAIEAVERKHELYGVDVAPAPDASAQAAAAAAGYAALSALFPKSNEVLLTTTYYNELARIADGPAKTKGIALGEAVARQVLASRQGDGADDEKKHFGQVKPFALRSADQFYVGPPPDQASDEFVSDLKRLQSLGERDSKTRTREQTEIGQFWANTTVGTYGSAGHFLRIAQILADQRKLSLGDEARLFALVGIALADGAIASVYWKNVYNGKRPADLIRAGNPSGTLPAQPNWQPLSPTGGLDHPSTLSTYAGSTAAVLQAFLKTDKVRFTLDSVGLPGVTRTYTSIAAAADESAISRVYSGYHTGYAIRNGREVLGPAIGKYVAENLLRPVKRDSVASK